MSRMGPTSAPLAPSAAAREQDDRSANDTIETFLVGVEHRSYRFALYELWDREAALDAVQDSMCRLVERYADRPATEWPAIFFTILRNRTTDAKRWRMMERLRGLLPFGSRTDDDREDPWMTIAAPDNENPEAETATKQQRRALERALAELPARQRQVFLLREWQGMTTKEPALARRRGARSGRDRHGDRPWRVFRE